MSLSLLQMIIPLLFMSVKTIICCFCHVQEIVLSYMFCPVSMLSRGFLFYFGNLLSSRFRSLALPRVSPV